MSFIDLMRERIVIQRSTIKSDSIGNHMAVWEDYFSCAAYVNSLSGREYEAAALHNAQTEIIFTIRWCSEVKDMNSESYRIIFNGRIYNISFVDNVQYRNRTVKLRATLVRGVMT